MKYYNNKVIWITGASSGIGFAVLELLSKMNTRLIITSSNIDKLEKAAEIVRANGSECTTLQADLSIIDDVERVAYEALNIYNRIDVLILNAGKSTRGLVEDTKIKVDREIMNLNYFSNVVITKKVLTVMKKNGGGNIAVTSSITGKFGFPLRSAYAASKHALHGFFESLSIEERRNGIMVSVICPGRINTPISISALMPNGEKYNKIDEGQKDGMPAEECAKKYLIAVKNSKREVFIGNKEILMVYFKKYIPKLFYKLAAKIKPT